MINGGWMKEEKPASSYSNWCRVNLNHPFQRTDAPLSKCALDILRFLAESGQRTKYDMSRSRARYKPGERTKGRPRKGDQGLDYEYAQIHRNVKILMDQGLIETREFMDGALKKRSLRLTFPGLIAFFSAWKTVDQEAVMSIKRALNNHSHFLPLILWYWDEIVRVGGEIEACNALINAAQKEGFFIRIAAKFNEGIGKVEFFMPYDEPGYFVKGILNERIGEFIMKNEALFSTFVLGYMNLQMMKEKIYKDLINYRIFMWTDLFNIMRVYRGEEPHRYPSEYFMIKDFIEFMREEGLEVMKAECLKGVESFDEAEDFLLSLIPTVSIMEKKVVKQMPVLIFKIDPGLVFTGLFIEELLWGPSKPKGRVTPPAFIESFLPIKPNMIVSFNARRTLKEPFIAPSLMEAIERVVQTRGKG